MNGAQSPFSARWAPPRVLPAHGRSPSAPRLVPKKEGVPVFSLRDVGRDGLTDSSLGN